MALSAMCAGCVPELDPACSYYVEAGSLTYTSNLELFTLKIDHSVSAEEFNLYQSSAEMRSHGVVTADGSVVDSCLGAALVV